jgi:hypothetical protein
VQRAIHNFWDWFSALLSCFKNASWKPCSVSVFITAWDSASITSSVLKWRSFSFIFNEGSWRKVRWVGGENHVVLAKNSLVKKEVWNGALYWCNSQFICCKSSGNVFAHFHAVTVKYRSTMWSLPFGMSGRILREQSPWYQRKWRACSWLYSSPVLHFSVFGLFMNS